MPRKLLVMLTLVAFALADGVTSLAYAKASAPICLTGVSWPKGSKPNGN